MALTFRLFVTPVYLAKTFMLGKWRCFCLAQAFTPGKGSGGFPLYMSRPFTGVLSMSAMQEARKTGLTIS
jgi:hypothetical protein